MAGIGVRTRETPVLMGKHKSLVGILAEPSQPPPAARHPAVVLLNAGIIHRVGPNRIYVLLARALAAAGIASVRFDMSGIGDSPSRGDAMEPLDSAMSDIREALEWLEANKQVRKVILLGLCAGADHSIMYASSDRRVVGTVLLDPSIPRTRKSYINQYRMRLLNVVRISPNEALDRLAKLWQRNPALASKGQVADDPSDRNLTDDELRALFEGHYRQCVQAGVQILAVFTGGVQGQHNYREQILDAFPDVVFGDRLSLEYVPESDHSFTHEADRAWLVLTILQWIERARFTTAGAQC